MIARIKSDNFNGKSVNITFTPDTGGTININNVVIPYDYSTDYPYGSYSIEVIGEGITCPLDIPNPVVATPTPTPTTTATPTPTITPTATPTPTPTPFVATASISPTGITQYYDVVLTGSTNITSPTYIWSLTGFTDTSGNTISSYTGNPLTEGYFSSTGSSNVLLTITGDNTLYPGNPVTATTTNFEVEVQDPFIVATFNNNNNLSYSTDAINWSGTTNVLTNTSSIAYGERTILFGRVSSGTHDRVSYLTGGTTTILSDLTSSSVRINGIKYASWLGEFFTSMNSSNTQFRSPNGINWSATTPSGIVVDTYTIETDEDNQQIILINDVGGVFVSTGGTSYSATTTLASSAYAIIRNRTLGYTIATKRDSPFSTYISQDNITWSAQTDNLSGQTWVYSQSYRESDGRTLVVSYTTNTGSITDDGINWSATTLPDIDGNYYLTSTYVPPPVDLFVAVSRSGKIVTSPDGIIWTQRTESVGGDCFVVDYGYRQS